MIVFELAQSVGESLEDFLHAIETLSHAAVGGGLFRLEFGQVLGEAAHVAALHHRRGLQMLARRFEHRNEVADRPFQRRVRFCNARQRLEPSLNVGDLPEHRLGFGPKTIVRLQTLSDKVGRRLDLARVQGRIFARGEAAFEVAQRVFDTAYIGRLQPVFEPVHPLCQRVDIEASAQLDLFAHLAQQRADVGRGGLTIDAFGEVLDDIDERLDFRGADRGGVLPAANFLDAGAQLCDLRDEVV